MTHSAENDVLAMLERRGVITTDPGPEGIDAEECCGLPRDEDGFCSYKPKHPIYVIRFAARVFTSAQTGESA